MDTILRCFIAAGKSTDAAGQIFYLSDRGGNGQRRVAATVPLWLPGTPNGESGDVEVGTVAISCAVKNFQNQLDTGKRSARGTWQPSYFKDCVMPIVVTVPRAAFCHNAFRVACARRIWAQGAKNSPGPVTKVTALPRDLS
jgi:hypothetical protein